MPQSIEAIGLTTLALAAAVAVVALYLRYYGDDDPTDTLVLLWRRWAALGKPQSARPKKKRRRKPPPRKKRPPVKPEPARPRVGSLLPTAAPPARRRPATTRPPAPEDATPPIEDEEAPAPAEDDDEDIVPVGEDKQPAAAPEPPPPDDVQLPEEVEAPVPLEQTVPPRKRKAPAKRKAATKKRVPKREPKREPDIVRPVNTDNGDHVPLSTSEDDKPKERGEPKILLRQRFRRGLKRTRERLGAELREAVTGGATPEAFDRIEESLVAADVGAATASAVTEQLRDEIGLSDKTLATAVRDVMVAQLADADRRLRLVRGRLSVWVVVGVNGTGKTTTIAKLAARAKDLGVPVSLAAADTFRAAAVEQLVEWGRRLDVPVTKQAKGADPGAVVFDAIAHAKASGHRLLIVDTAGRLHTRKPLMDELQKVFRVIERTEDATIAECLLVIDATTGQNGIAQAKAFKDAVSVTGLTIAKLDGTAKGGIAFAVEKELGVPVKAVGVGEREKDLVPFEPKAFVDALIGEDE